MRKKIATVEFKDEGQDFLIWEIEFDDWFSLGKVVACKPLQAHIWCDYFVLSGKPVVGQKLKVSLSPDHEVIKLKYPIIEVAIK